MLLKALIHCYFILWGHVKEILRIKINFNFWFLLLYNLSENDFETVVFIEPTLLIYPKAFMIHCFLFNLFIIHTHGRKNCQVQRFWWLVIYLNLCFTFYSVEFWLGGECPARGNISQRHCSTWPSSAVAMWLGLPTVYK